MKFKVWFIFFLVSTFMMEEIAVANPIFTITGSVTKSDGSLADNGLTVTVSNASRDLTQISTLGEVEPGKFAITFIDIDGRAVAKVGDQLTVQVTSPQGKTLIDSSYQVTDSDLLNSRSVLALQIEPVKIDSVSLSADIARAGDNIVFSLTGTPGVPAKVSIGEVIQDLELSEESTGTYTGNYTVKDGDNAFESPVVFQLSAQINSTQKVTIDTTSPPAPTGLIVAGGEIDLDNLTAVSVSVTAEPFSSVSIALTDTSGQSVEERTTARALGQVKVKLDATKLLNGPITVTAQQDPDRVGNLGQISSVTIEKDTPNPTFSIRASQDKQKAAVGGEANFVLLLIGQSGFESAVNLSVDQSTLPLGTQAGFEPEVVIPTKAEPIQSTTLTVSTSGSTPSGSHQITVLARGGTQLESIQVTLTAEKLGAFITLNLSQSGQIQFSESIDTFGQVILIGEPNDQRAVLPIQMVTTAPDNSQKTYETNTQADRTYVIKSVAFDQVGTWTVTVTWIGDIKYQKVEKSESIGVTKAKPKLNWMTTPSTVNPTVEMLGNQAFFALQIEPILEGSSILLTISRPNQLASEKIRLTTDSVGVISKELHLDIDGNWVLQAEWEGGDSYQATKSFEHHVTVMRELGKAIVVMGGGDEDHNVSWRRFHTTVNHAYQTLIKRRFSDEDIFYLSPAKNPDPIVDEHTSEFQLERAITHWAKDKVSANVPLWIYLMSHNTNTSFLLEDSDQGQTFLEADKLGSWLDQIPEEVQVTVIIEACYSGNFIPVIGKKRNRVIITSTDSENQAQIHRSSSFSKFFFENARRNMSIADDFEDVVNRMERNAIHSGQRPRIDSNGNGVPNEPSDFIAVKTRYIPDNIEPLTKPIMTDLNATPSTLSGGLTASLFSVRIPGSAVMTQVQAMVIPSNFNFSQSFDNWVEFDTFNLADPDGDRIFVGSYGKFTQNGDYTVLLDAVDQHGNTADPLQVIITQVDGQEPDEPEPEPEPKLTGDVNGDNAVNIFDLVQVAGTFGKSGEGLAGDVNDDGMVNIFDLVQVASNFGKTAGAPMRLVDLSRFSHGSQTQALQRAIRALENYAADDAGLEAAVDALRQVMALGQRPEKTRLRQNYPNPFNPETWIPFELSQDSEVMLTIYDVVGIPVRTISLGYVKAGRYIDSSRAIYWNGRTDVGERVASGTYFYTLKAENYVSTQKMIILK